MFLQEMNLAVCGSQIVGLVPLQSILDAANYYVKRDSLFLLEEDQQIRLVSPHSIYVHWNGYSIFVHCHYLTGNTSLNCARFNFRTMAQLHTYHHHTCP